METTNSQRYIRLTRRERRFITTDDVMRVYSGKQGCMCGCMGNYSVNPNHITEADIRIGRKTDEKEVNIREVTRVLNKLIADDRTVLLDGFILMIDGDLRESGERDYVAYLSVSGQKHIKLFL